MTLNSLISAHDLHFSHEDGAPVLRGVDLEVRAGELLCILGANGSGKSTLLRLLAGARRPDRGEVIIDGAPAGYTTRGRNRARRFVQLVLQEPDEQIFATSVRADVAFGPHNQGVGDPTALVDAALAAVGISHLAERVPHQLSYGQRKRVALAGALAMRPQLLLLDEPTAGLDPGGSAQLAAVLRGVRGEGRGVVLTTHDVDLAYSLADRVAVLHEGRLTVGETTTVMGDSDLMERASLGRPWGAVLTGILRREIRSLADLPDI